ncbi:MAG TPA: SGNH/GDSL hydrolase family protein [Burkholderiales bacterium]|nr:SGNH/GDSL hydrolase family protein [Burkholderiales bacterium]
MKHANNVIMRRFIGTASLCAICAGTLPSHAAQSTPAAGEARWEDALGAFAAADLRRAPEPGGVLFVGSSSIRLWNNLESEFAHARVIKRGFGGSRLSDCVRLLDRLVIKYRPRTVLLYAGDNDLAEGSTPEEVLERVTAFANGVHSRLPDTRVTFISIKPSPARRALIGAARAANRLVADYAASHPGVDYIDVFTPMLTADGLPRQELFAKDALHLNDRGYALWRSLIRPFVR